MTRPKPQKPQRTREEPPVRSASSLLPTPAFHTPFRDLAQAFSTRAPAPPARPAVRSGGAAASPTRPDPLAEAPQEGGAEPPLTDAEALALSVAGAARLSSLSPRVRIRRRPDLSHIQEKRREDVEAMARAEGFDITHEDLYVRGRASGVSRELLARLERGEFPISAHLDLHGMPLEDARRAVDEFLVNQQKRGHRCVLLVTGKGKNSPRGHGVLRESVPEWLARGPSARRVLAFASARPCDGGLGALVVLMRGGSSSKNRIDVERGGPGPLT
jgi:DNA-nicking Smr family endonuclease